MSGTMFFAQHFGLNERPFTLLPDPDFLFWTKNHKRAFAVLEYGILTRAPITVITGEVGAGKTTLLQKMLRTLDEHTTIGLISNAQGGHGDLLQWVLGALSVPIDPSASYVTSFQALQHFVLEEYSARRHVLLVIDEAQNLSIEGLEELRMLTNINSGKDELLQLILMGQPELRATISRPELRQFAQRVSASYHIPSMEAADTSAYIQHRLRHAGGTGSEFTDEAIAIVQENTGGVPRLVNKMCDFAMLYAMTNDRPVVDAASVNEVVGDSLFIITDEGPDGVTPAPPPGDAPPADTSVPGPRFDSDSPVPPSAPKVEGTRLPPWIRPVTSTSRKADE